MEANATRASDLLCVPNQRAGTLQNTLAQFEAQRTGTGLLQSRVAGEIGLDAATKFSWKSSNETENNAPVPSPTPSSEFGTPPVILHRARAWLYQGEGCMVYVAWHSVHQGMSQGARVAAYDELRAMLDDM